MLVDEERSPLPITWGEGFLPIRLPVRHSTEPRRPWCGVSEITIHSLRSNWPGARREGGRVSAAILDRLSNEAPGPFQRNPKGGMSFGRRRCCSLLTDPLRDMLWCPCGSTSRLASAQNPLPRMYSLFRRHHTSFALP